MPLRKTLRSSNTIDQTAQGGFTMRRVLLRAFGAFLLLALLLVPLIASAHQTTTDGDYNIEYGWVNEPVIINQPNAVVINITKTVTATGTTTDTTPADVDVSGLVISASYGGQIKTLKLQPLAENTPGQFVAPMMPTVAGQYTIMLSGKIDGNPIDSISVQPEDAQTPDVVQFPKAADANAAVTSQFAAIQSQGGTTQLIAIAALVLGLIGTGLGAYALMRKH
jgi:hypothetical protein